MFLFNIFVNLKCSTFHLFHSRSFRKLSTPFNKVWNFCVENCLRVFFLKTENTEKAIEDSTKLEQPKLKSCVLLSCLHSVKGPKQPATCFALTSPPFQQIFTCFHLTFSSCSSYQNLTIQELTLNLYIKNVQNYGEERAPASFGGRSQASS